MSDDLIRRSDAIKAINLKARIPHDVASTHYASISINAICSVPSADRPQGWIPCSERLPREYEVLCCDIYKNCIVGHPFADDSASTGFCAESEGEFMYECVAWMPLPEPWKGE